MMMLLLLGVRSVQRVHRPTPNQRPCCIRPVDRQPLFFSSISITSVRRLDLTELRSPLALHPSLRTRVCCLHLSFWSTAILLTCFLFCMYSDWLGYAISFFFFSLSLSSYSRISLFWFANEKQTGRSVNRCAYVSVIVGVDGLLMDVVEEC